jgi:hypothetical protein
MNLPLQREIISHIYKSLGVFVSDNDFRPGFIESLVQDKFLLTKKLAFETEDKQKHKNDLWGSMATVGNSVIKVMVADISDIDSEYAVLIQMDNFTPHALRLSKNETDFGTIVAGVGENDWANAGTLLQAKLLSGIESLAEFVVEWKKLDDFEFLYKKLIMFLNFQEEQQQ